MIKESEARARKRITRENEVKPITHEHSKLSGLSLLAFSEVADRIREKSEHLEKTKGADAPTVFSKSRLTDLVNTSAQWELINHKGRFNNLMKAIDEGMTNSQVREFASEVKEKAQKAMKKAIAPKN